jgi:hypothetical protein
VKLVEGVEIEIADKVEERELRDITAGASAFEIVGIKYQRLPYIATLATRLAI